MGLTYAELCVFGRLRKVERLGPVSMFDRMVYKETYSSLEELATKIKRFFTHYGNNRHKVTTLPPTFFYDPESCDDNRFDMRPWFYATDWSYQFDIIDERVREMKIKEEGSTQSNLLPATQRHERRKSYCERDEHQELIHINVILPPAQEKDEEMKDIFDP
jgi:hypothetical protein